MKIEQITKNNCANYSDNPVYVWHAIRFLAGGFYRSVLGYDIIKDKDQETEMLNHLDFFLNHLNQKEDYQLKLFKTKDRYPTRLRGIPWRGNSVPPIPLKNLKPALYVIPPNTLIHFRKTRNYFSKNRYDFEFEDINGNYCLMSIRSTYFNPRLRGLKEVRNEKIYGFSRNSK